MRSDTKGLLPTTAQQPKAGTKALHVGPDQLADQNVEEDKNEKERDKDYVPPAEEDELARI